MKIMKTQHDFNRWGLHSHSLVLHTKMYCHLKGQMSPIHHHSSRQTILKCHATQTSQTISLQHHFSRLSLHYLNPSHHNRKGQTMPAHQLSSSTRPIRLTSLRKKIMLTQYHLSKGRKTVPNTLFSCRSHKQMKRTRHHHNLQSQASQTILMYMNLWSRIHQK